MALAPSRMLSRSRAMSRASDVCYQCRRSYAVAPSVTSMPASPLLFKLKGDLKTAMKEKDTNRLNVLRGIIADVTNSSKTSNPIKTDMQLVSLLRKRMAAAKEASNDFQAAGRDDLVEKEQAQAAVFEEYAGSVETLSEDDIKSAVTKVVDEMTAVAQGKVNMGDALKKLLGAGGSLEGKNVDRSEVARVVKQVLGQKTNI
ncbi:domain-containing [Lecanosticta acicola]|uniref:Altered inheritance of mitochondria protein 41 n=1 Tax=Lecanosticta acicola TaxID=111012 RepID=A0AAI8Z6M4_9PEZI|nr:domain-containing [Lecanosticta acicola]